MAEERSEIRLALPSKGVLAEDTITLLRSAGMPVYKPNQRQYKATIPALPEVTVLFQRPGDIVTSIFDGSVDFGITGWDMVAERQAGFDNGNEIVLPLLRTLGYGSCSLNIIVPEEKIGVEKMGDLRRWQSELSRPLRVATKFPHLTRAFFVKHGLEDIQLVQAEGTLEIAPTIGYADLIADLVSSGTTLRDNRLRILTDGQVLHSQACLIANKAALQKGTAALEVARQLIEFVVAHMRAIDNVSVFANVRGSSPEAVATAMFSKKIIGGLQGPTISSIITASGETWYDVHIIVRKDLLSQAIRELREVGGSGVVVTPVSYIFEEEPEEYLAMLNTLQRSPASR